MWTAVSCLRPQKPLISNNTRAPMNKKIILAFSLSVAVLFSWADGVVKGNVFTNPVIPTSVPDPCVIKAPDGYFYLNGTRVNAYQLVKYEGDYYFIGVGNKYVTNKWQYVAIPDYVFDGTAGQKEHMRPFIGLMEMLLMERAGSVTAHKDGKAVRGHCELSGADADLLQPSTHHLECQS